MSIELDCTDIIEIFKTHLKIDNSVKSIAHTFLNARYASRIDFAPYFQRKYVWDEEKASYFIESILLGTEIPPIVLFDNGNKNEVIDGRQRYETIKRFLDNQFPLCGDGLKALSTLSGVYYANLPEEIQDNFKNTKIRILQFSIVNEPALTEEQEDKVKKEIFRRYNSGIIALKPQEIERAAYIKDPLVHAFKEELERDPDLLKKCQQLLLPKRKQNIKDRDKINHILVRVRSFAAASSKSDVIQNYFLLRVEKESTDLNISNFRKIINKIFEIRACLPEESSITENNLFFESLYWGLSIVLREAPESFDKLDAEQFATDIENSNSVQTFWKGVNVENQEFEMVFFSTGSHFYMSILNRYTFIANYLSEITGVDFSMHFKDKAAFEKVMSENPTISQYHDYKLSKTDPVSATVYDILDDVKNSHFIIRPDYQRSEVSNNILKASYILESILLGIRIPPIFIFRRKDRVSEVIDGQQRLLSILGFLGEPYKDINGQAQFSDKNRFKLSKLRFLTDLNGKDIDGIDALNPKFKDRILDFQIDIVEINESQNPNFSPIDLFLRLNSKPFPIDDNSFEMWNAYVTREFVERIKKIAEMYAGKLFRSVDTRMKNEELITMLAFLAYIQRKENIKPEKYLNVFVRNQRINARFSTKRYITATLGEVSRKNDALFGNAIDDVVDFINKMKVLCGDGFEVFTDLIAHPKKNTQSRTNQNFYLLWIAVAHISIERLVKDKDHIYHTIRNLFVESQEIKDDSFDAENFVQRLASI